MLEGCRSLTISTGDDIPTLQKQTHDAWCRRQRPRTWPQEVFGWLRGTVVVTGRNGRWKLYLHVVVTYWTTKVSYKTIWGHWAKAVGEGGQVDAQTLADYGRTARGRGTAHAGRYIVKHLTKRENLDVLEP